MPLVKWQPTEVFQSAGSPALAPARTEPIVTKRARPREDSWPPITEREVQQAPLHESTLLTPGGHRKHVLERTSPGGTKRRSEYISPRKKATQLNFR